MQKRLMLYSSISLWQRSRHGLQASSHGASLLIISLKSESSHLA